MKQYTSTINLVNFTDNSVPPSNWQREYTHWNFNDGSNQDTGLFVSHTFPQAQIYNVFKETRYSEIGNPSNFCLATSSIAVNASLSNPVSVCYSPSKFKVKWLTGLTYGISSFPGQCPYSFKEIAVDTGYVTSFSSTGSPVSSIFSTNQDFLTYTLPGPPYVYAFIQHVNRYDPNNSGGITPSVMIYVLDSIRQTPTDCHASFFMLPSDATMHNWTIQDFSTGNDSLSYSWDFGDGNTSTLASPSHTYSSIGLYTICLTVSSGTCSDTYCETALVDTTVSGAGVHSINVQKMIITGIKEKQKDALVLKVFPNPANHELNVMYPFNNENYTIHITNLLGQDVLTQKVSGTSLNTLNLPVEALQNGLYQVQISSGTGAVLAKTRFVKQ